VVANEQAREQDSSGVAGGRLFGSGDEGLSCGRRREGLRKITGRIL
jgi:hypothetical protein